jgi:hypothetical protein
MRDEKGAYFLLVTAMGGGELALCGGRGGVGGGGVIGLEAFGAFQGSADDDGVAEGVTMAGAAEDGLGVDDHDEAGGLLFYADALS